MCCVFFAGRLSGDSRFVWQKSAVVQVETGDNWHGGFSSETNDIMCFMHNHDTVGESEEVWQLPAEKTLVHLWLFTS